MVIRVDAPSVVTSTAIRALVEEYRAVADAYIFLSGGASEVSDAVSGQLRTLLDALPRLVAQGLRLAVGDGGTRAGIMEWAGLVRRRSGGAFPLLGVAPAEEVTVTPEPGRTTIDPNHSHVVLVANPEWTGHRGADRARGGGHWGAETDAMYEIFGRLSAGCASAAVVVNGGAITLDEVERNLVRDGRSSWWRAAAGPPTPSSRTSAGSSRRSRHRRSSRTRSRSSVSMSTVISCMSSTSERARRA